MEWVRWISSSLGAETEIVNGCADVQRVQRDPERCGCKFETSGCASTKRRRTQHYLPYSLLEFLSLQLVFVWFLDFWAYRRTSWRAIYRLRLRGVQSNCCFLELLIDYILERTFGFAPRLPVVIKLSIEKTFRETSLVHTRHIPCSFRVMEQWSCLHCCGRGMTKKPPCVVSRPAIRSQFNDRDIQGGIGSGDEHNVGTTVHVSKP